MFVDIYLSLKSLHIIAVICWMAAILYLPRLFVYHSEVPVNSNRDLMLRVMERKLLNFIMNPSAIIVAISGLLLIIHTYVFSQGFFWIYAKLLCVSCIAFHHLLCMKYTRDFRKGENKKSSKFFRIFNEIPAVFMIIIVVLVVTKMF